MTVLVAAVLAAVPAGCFALGAYWMWWRTEVRKMQLGSVLERNLKREADLIGEQTYKDRVMAALPPEREPRRTGLYDWSVERPELMP